MLIILGEHINSPLKSFKGLGRLKVIEVSVSVLAYIRTAVREYSSCSHNTLVKSKTEYIIGTVVIGILLALSHKFIELIFKPIEFF